MNKIYFHIAKIGNYAQICDEIFSTLKLSGILNDSKLYLSIVGVEPDLNYFNEYEIIYRNDDITVGEQPTLKIMYGDALKSNNDNFLYIHTKGVTTPNNPCIDDWRNYMLYFNVIKYSDCVNVLKNYDTCGVDLRSTPVLHYSGNFWWAKSNYIKTLMNINDMKIVLTERHKAEFWICSSKEGKHFSLWDCGIDVYERHLYRYCKNNYVL
jgi:hypothetical protein